MYSPGIGGTATVKLPVIWKVGAPAILHTTPTPKPGGKLAKPPAQAPASAPLKPAPVMEITAEDPPLLGTNTIFGKTLNAAVPKSPVEPVTVTTHANAPWAVGPTVNWPEREPDEVIVHVNVEKRLAAAGAVIVHVPASNVSNPEPETVTAVPGEPETGGEPKFGVSMTVGATPTPKLAEAVSPTPAPVTVTV